MKKVRFFSSQRKQTSNQRHNNRSRIAMLCVPVLLFGSLNVPAYSQTVSACNPAQVAPFPHFSDSLRSPGGQALWAPADTESDQHLVLGDIDGDGQDELIAVDSQGLQVQIWHWSYTTWTPMLPIPIATIQTAFTPGFTTAKINKVSVANVDGGSQKELVIFLINLDGPTVNGGGDEELIYKYNAPTLSWSLLRADAVAPTDGYSSWFKQHPNDVQDSRFRLAGNHINLTLWVNGAWANVAGNQNGIDATSIANCHNIMFDHCVAFADLNGDGITDMVYLNTAGFNDILLSSPNEFFDDPINGPPLNANDPLVTNSWHVADIDGDGQGELLWADEVNLNAYYWNSSMQNFSPYPDPNHVLINYEELLPTAAQKQLYGPSLTIVPPPGLGAFIMGPGGTSTFSFYNLAAGRKIVYQPYKGGFSGSAGYGQPGYLGYFRIGNENVNGGQVFVARNSTGIVTEIGGPGFSFVDPSTGSDRGYPAFTTSQQAAYRYIGANVSPNPDLRSLYTDPGVPWATIENKIAAMPVPPSSTGISAADFQFVQNQLTQELTAIQTVNLLYGVTGQILTNSYLVQDAALTEIQDVLAIQGNPDVTGEVLSAVTSALNDLGAGLEAINGVMVIYKVADTAERISNVISGAGELTELIGQVTSQAGQYTAANPSDSSAATYSLKTTLDSNALGAATSNVCTQSASLSSWSQSKPISDGVLTGVVPLDLETQQDLTVAAQAQMQLQSWQALLPTKWSVAMVWPTGGGTFQDTPQYPLAYTLPAECSGSPEWGVLVENDTNNYPSITGLNALFSSPPVGVAMLKNPMFYSKSGWNIPDFFTSVGSGNLNFNINTLTEPGCPVAMTTPLNSAEIRTAQQDFVGRGQGDRGRSNSASGKVKPDGIKSVNTRLSQLIADVNTKLIDPKLSNTLAGLLQVASDRLRQDVKWQREPSDPIHFLNKFISQSQFHAGLGLSDSNESAAEAVEAVAIRDLLIDSMPVNMASNDIPSVLRLQ